MNVLSLKEEDFGLRSISDVCVKCTICETQCPVMRVTDLLAGPKHSGPQAERHRKDGQIVDSLIDYYSSCGTRTLVCLQGTKVTEMIYHARAAMKKEKGILPRDHPIGRTGFVGTVMTPVAPITNWAPDVKATCIAMGKAIGAHRNAPMPHSAGRTFESRFKKYTPPPGSGRKGQVIFFHGCAGQYFEVEILIHSVRVLEHLGYEVLVPYHGRCGPALQSNGLYDESRKYVSKLMHDLRKANRNAPIISTPGSRAGMLRHEANEILEMDTPELWDVGSRMWDIYELLMHLHDKGELDLNLQPMEITIPYHAPCQLKSQGLGLPAVELMESIPGAMAKESNQPCCGTAGTYGMKKEKHDIIQAVGKPAFDFIEQANVELVAYGAETCRWQLRTMTGVDVVRPVWLIHKAYGLHQSLQGHCAPDEDAHGADGIYSVGIEAHPLWHGDSP